MLKKVIPSVMCASLFFACSDGTVTNVNDEAKENAKISFLVLDAYSDQAIDSVTVYRPKDGKSDITDSLGYSIWKNNEIGNYIFELSKGGYATIRTSVDVTEEGLGDVARVPDVLASVHMYKLGVTVNGTILYTDPKTNNKIAASNITVILSNENENIIPTEIAVKTDNEGNYSFTNMPAGVNFFISVPQTTIDGIVYESSGSLEVPASRSGAIKDLSASTISATSSDIILVKSNLNAIDTTTNISLTFSQELADSSIKYFTVSLSSGLSTLVKAEISSKNPKNITISPISGKWTNGSRYNLSGKAYSKEGAYTSISRSFTVGEKSSSNIPGQVKNLEIELNGSYLDLTWDKDSSATGYNIYYKTQEMSDYLKHSSTSYSYANINYSRFLGDSDSTKCSFIVLPYNNNGSAPVDGAKSVSYTFKAPDAQVSDLNVKLSGSYIDLNWEAPASGSYYYRIYYKSTSMSEYDTIDYTSRTYYTTNYSVSRYFSEGDTAISFKVVPYNNLGQASLAKANPVSLSVQPPTAKVKNLTVTMDGNYPSLNWDAPGIGSYTYAVYYRTSSDNEYTSVTSTSYTNYSSKSLLSYYTTSADTALFFKVVTKNSFGTASLKDADSVYLKLSLSKVVSVKQTTYTQYYKLSWSAPNIGTAIGYRIYYKTSSMNSYSKESVLSTSYLYAYAYGNTSSSSYINLSNILLSADTAIAFKVVPYNSKDSGSIAEADSLHIGIDPGSASDLIVTFDSNYYNLKWSSSPKSASGYRIYYKTNSMTNYVLNSSTSSNTTKISITTTAEDTEISFKIVPYNLVKEATDVNSAEFTYELTTKVQD